MNNPSAHPNLRTAPPFEKGNQVAWTHGGQVSAWRVGPRAAEIASTLREVLPVRSDADEPLIAVLANAWARLELMTAWLDKNGLMDSHNRPRPVLKLISTTENTCARLLDQLGCSPTSRARLGLDVVRAGQALRDHIERNYGTKGDGDA